MAPPKARQVDQRVDSYDLNPSQLLCLNAKVAETGLVLHQNLYQHPSLDRVNEMKLIPHPAVVREEGIASTRNGTIERASSRNFLIIYVNIVLAYNYLSLPPPPPPPPPPPLVACHVRVCRAPDHLL